MNPSIFKANDIRGKYPEEINEEAVFEIAGAVGKYFGRSAKIVVGCDARLSSPTLYRTVIDGIMNQESRIRNGELGIMNNELRIKNNKLSKKSKAIIHNSKFIIHEAGLMTTPMLYFLVNELKADGGIMVTASHNPKEYNGLKIVGKKAVPMSGSEILRIMNNELGIRN